MTLRSPLLIAATFLLTTSTIAQHVDPKNKELTHEKYEVWSIAPVHLFESCIGTSISYERGIDAGGIVTYMLQAMGGVDLTKKYASNRATEDPIIFIMPGLKFYPTTRLGHTKYAVGPSLVIGAGQASDYSSYYPSDRVGTRFLLGIMVNNSLNYQFGQRVYLGIDYGLGFSYIDKSRGVNSGVNLLNQLAFRMGYRF
ncbi:hypothetical protein [Flavipsychrobacter stenotrophus]|uniref:hypothetical protein n=1 Tax=Flavipsychrobacter stenotrophus TaxID=2077091 RepID=UPI0010573B95|nr:hypothetical protein [Flavipsychrobacter stenotrophus]